MQIHLLALSFPLSLSLPLSLVSFSFSLFSFADSSRCTRDEKGALALARVPRPKNSPLARRAEPRAIRVFLRLEAASPPTRSLPPPRQSCRLCWTRPRFSFHDSPCPAPVWSRPPVLCPCCSNDFSSSFSWRPNNSPTLGYSVLRPRSPWPVGGQANVRESSSVAAHMHATASDRCTTSRRRRSRSRSRSYRRRNASRKLSSKCIFDHAEREGRVDRLTWLILLTGRR